jgi:hypothetical protein
MNDNDGVEDFLREQFEGPVPDDGFCDRVMERVPARRRRHAWPLAAGISAGGTLCWLSLHSVPFLRSGWHDWLSGELSAPAITLLATMASISLLAVAWSVAEADDR